MDRFKRYKTAVFAAHAARGGNVTIIFAFAVALLILLVFGAIDINRASVAKQTLQDALDAATLYVAKSSATSNKDLQDIGAKALTGDLGNLRDGKLKSSSFKSGQDGASVVSSAKVEVTTTILGIFGRNKLTVGADAEVMRSSTNLEVALVLDTTGSMSGQKIADLKTAAADLVDLVINEQQSPYYSKAALVPYSMAVNVGAYAQAVRGAYTNGTCTSPGCQTYRFNSPYGGTNSYPITTCVTERTGPHAFTDSSPTTALLGRNYAGPGNPCLANTIVPLTSDKSMLKAKIDDLEAEGSTAGHIGVAWGWYMLSPHFASLWPSSSQPAAYHTPKLIKAAVIMTDGEFNTAYCNGVISQDSLPGSGPNSEHINCDAPNGTAFVQAQKLCANMKAEGVVVYTVGFDVVNDQRAKDLVSQCATDSAHVYLPSSGSALKAAFHAIGQDISNLRLSK